MTPINPFRKLPIGIQEFEKLRTEGYLYVDKTAFVYELVSTGAAYFLSRPRPFGKSLLISTFQAYFAGKKELFEGLDIEQLEKDWTTYPVLHLDLNARNYEDENSLLEELNKHTFLMVEYGIESTCDETLKRINRGHTYADTVEAVCQTAACGILTGGHIILGLPGETHDTMVAHAEILSDLPLATLKIHQLQLIRGTRMAHEYDVTPAGFHLFNEVEEYIDLVIDYVEHLRPDMVVERFVSQSPKDLLIAPDWGLKNYEFVARLQKRMKERGAYQGKKYRDSEKRIIFANDKLTT